MNHNGNEQKVSIPSTFIYFIVVLIIAYNIFFDSYAEKNTSVEQVRCYLSLKVSDDTELVEYIADMKGRFIVWSVLDSPNKDIAYKLKKLESFGWKLYSIKENNKRIYYTFKKNNIIYQISDYKNSNKWKEDVFVEE